jgi:hypothetical protein
MKRGSTGQYEITATGDETVRAFVPAPLPPDPVLDLSGTRQRLLERALLACGRLDGVTSLLLPMPSASSPNASCRLQAKVLVCR